MIGIKVNSEFLDLSEDAKIQLRLISPLFLQEKADTSHTFSFTLPASPNNQRILNHPDLLLRTSTQVEFETELHFDYLVLRQGKLKILRVSPSGETYSVRILVDTAPVMTEWNRTLLKDIDLGLYTLPRTPGVGIDDAELLLELEATTPPPFATIVGITINGYYYQDTWLVGNGEIARDCLQRLEALINVDSALHYVKVQDETFYDGTTHYRLRFNIDPLAPSVAWLPFEIDFSVNQQFHVWTIISYTSPGEVSDDVMQSHMKTVNQSAVGTYPYCFTPVQNLSFCEQSTYSGFINNMKPNNGNIFNNSNSNSSWLFRNVCVPFPQVTHLIDKICESVGYTNISAITQAPEFGELHLYNNRNLGVIENSPQHEFAYGADPINWFKAEINIQDHVPPNLTVGEFIRGIAYAFNQAIILDNQAKTLNLYPRAASLSTQEQWTDKTLDNIDFGFPELEGFTLTFQKDSSDENWKSNGDQLPDYLYGNGKKEIEVPLAPLFEFKGKHPNQSRYWLTPSINQPGTIPELDLSNDPCFRVFWYRGEYTTDDGKNYPMGTWGNVDYHGDPAGIWLLSWDGTNGLFDVWWEEWMAFMEKAKELNVRIRLTEADIITLDHARKKFIQLYEGQAGVLVRQIDVELTHTGISPAKLDCLAQ